MTKTITIKLTEAQAWTVWRAVGNDMQDYLDDYGQANVAKENREARKVNAFLERLQDKIAKQIYAQQKQTS